MPFKPVGVDENSNFPSRVMTMLSNFVSSKISDFSTLIASSYAPLSGPSFTGNPTVNGNSIVTSDLLAAAGAIRKTVGAPTSLASDADGDYAVDLALNVFYGPFSGNGTTGTWPSGVVLSSTWLPTDDSLNGATDDPGHISAAFAPTSGAIYLMRIRAMDSRVLSSVLLHIVTAATGLTANQNVMGIYALVGTDLLLVGTTADQSTIWTSAGLKNMALTAQAGQSLAVKAGQKYFIGFLCSGSGPPAIAKGTSSAGINGTGINAGVTAPPYRWSAGPTGQTALPNTITSASLASGANSIWVGAK